MEKNYSIKHIILIFIFCIIIYLLLSNSFEIMESIRLSFYLCIHDLFPALIPSLFISNILIKYNFLDELSSFFKFSSNIFKVSKKCSFIIIMSLISGTPSNAKYINDLLEEELITLQDAKNCLKFCHFTNPFFILNTIGVAFLNNKKMGFIILLGSYLSALIIGLFNKKSIKVSKYKIKEKRKESFINILNMSIKNIIDTLLLILGIITFFIIITTILNLIIKIPNDFKFIYGILEMTQGIKYLSSASFNINLKAIISSFIISFGGICIHMQVFSILNNKKIRYFPYFLSRLTQAILASIITYIFITVFG